MMITNELALTGSPDSGKKECGDNGKSIIINIIVNIIIVIMTPSLNQRKSAKRSFLYYSYASSVANGL